MRFLGIDLAWGEGSENKPANRSGVVALEPDGRIVDAGWTIGLAEMIAWMETHRLPDTLAFIDAPLVIMNTEGQRLADKNVGQRYGRWKVSANSINTNSKHKAGVRLRLEMEKRGWKYADGRAGPERTGSWLHECYPYTTIVGVERLGYVDERPPYKRAAKGMPAANAWPRRIAACGGLIERIAALVDADPPMDLLSHAETSRLVREASPAKAAPYKQREDLLDAAICAWTASYWSRWGLERCQILGAEDPIGGDLLATIIAPARAEQREAPSRELRRPRPMRSGGDA